MLGSSPIFHSHDRSGPPGTAPPETLVSEGALGGGTAFARASSALLLGPDGQTWQEAPADTPRFHGAARRLLSEGPRTNLVRNPRMEGAAGANPTHVSIVNIPAELTVTPVGAVTEGGIPLFRWRLQGTLAAEASLRFNLDGTGGPPGIAIPAGGKATLSCFFRNGGTAMTRAGMRATGSDSGNAAAAVPLPAHGTLGRLSRALTYPAATGNSAIALVLTVPPGAVDSLIDLGAGQFEQNAAFASSPILPPAGTLAASTRAADLASLALSAAAAARGTLVGTFVLTQPSPAGTHQGLLALDDGTADNRILLRNPGGGLGLVPVRVSGGTETAGDTLGTATAGTPFRAALAWDANGIAACVAGGPVQPIPGAIPALTRILIGQGRSDLSAALFGEIASLGLYPARQPDASLQALTSP